MSTTKLQAKRRVIFYIDGFNCYFGLKDSNWKGYYWLDYPKLTKRLAQKLDNSELIATKYFTSRIKSPEDKRIRQKEYLEVLQMRGNIQTYFGDYKEGQYTCSNPNCARPNFIQNEKQTDVNIAVQMMVDAYEDSFDVAVLISGDSDLVPPIKEIKRLFPNKQIMACFPPKRYSKEIRNVSNGELHIKEADFKNNQLPNEILRGDGYVYKRPDYWK